MGAIHKLVEPYLRSPNDDHYRQLSSLSVDSGAERDGDDDELGRRITGFRETEYPQLRGQ